MTVYIQDSFYDKLSCEMSIRIELSTYKRPVLGRGARANFRYITTTAASTQKKTEVKRGEETETYLYRRLGAVKSNNILSQN